MENHRSQTYINNVLYLLCFSFFQQVWSSSFHLGVWRPHPIEGGICMCKNCPPREIQSSLSCWKILTLKCPFIQRRNPCRLHLCCLWEICSGQCALITLNVMSVYSKILSINHHHRKDLFEHSLWFIVVEGCAVLSSCLYSVLQSFQSLHARNRRVFCFPQNLEGLDLWVVRLRLRSRLITRVKWTVPDTCPRIPALLPQRHPLQMYLCLTTPSTLPNQVIHCFSTQGTLT